MVGRCGFTQDHSTSPHHSSHVAQLCSLGGTKRMRTLTHPLVLLCCTVASVFLWMPFGMGYYDWPWDSQLMRFVIRCFVFGFPVLAAVGCVRAFRPQKATGRLVVSSLSLLVALFGVFAMIWWMSMRDVPPNQSPEPTAVGAVSSAIAVHVTNRRWLSFFR